MSNISATFSGLHRACAALYTVIWLGIIIAVFAPLAVRRYRTMSR